MPMGRPKKHDRHLPPRMRHKHGAYYRVAGGRWEPLGKVYGEALRLWAELEAAPSRVSTIGEAIQAYEIDKVPKLAEATRRDYRRICGVLREVFAEVGIDDLEPTDVAQYLEKRSHAIAGNREIAVLSSVFNYAMRLGHAKANPCRGVARNKERHRTRLPTLQATGNDPESCLLFRRSSRAKVLTLQGSDRSYETPREPAPRPNPGSPSCPRCTPRGPRRARRRSPRAPHCQCPGGPGAESAG